MEEVTRQSVHGEGESDVADKGQNEGASLDSEFRNVEFSISSYCFLETYSQQFIGPSLGEP